MRTLLTLTAGIFLSLVVSCSGSNTDSVKIAMSHNEHRTDISESDAEFIVEAADASALDIKLGELAQTNAGSQSVKDFGKMMVADHTKAADELKALAQRKNIVLASTLSDKSQHLYDKLAKKTGKDFDTE